MRWWVAVAAALIAAVALGVLVVLGVMMLPDRLVDAPSCQTVAEPTCLTVDQRLTAENAVRGMVIAIGTPLALVISVLIGMVPVLRDRAGEETATIEAALAIVTAADSTTEARLVAMSALGRAARRDRSRVAMALSLFATRRFPPPVDDLIIDGDDQVPLERRAPDLAAALHVLGSTRFAHVKRDLIHVDLRKGDLSGLDLRGIDFQGSSLNGASFRHADLRDATFVGADLRFADLTGAGLRRTSFADALVDKMVVNSKWFDGTGSIGNTVRQAVASPLTRSEPAKTSVGSRKPRARSSRRQGKASRRG